MTRRARIRRAVVGAGLAALAALGPAGGVGEADGLGARAPSSRPLVVVDSTGRLVGRAVGDAFRGAVPVLVQAAGRDILLDARPDRLGTSTLLAVAGFEESDCSGTPWLVYFSDISPAPTPEPLFEPVAVAPDGLVYAAASGAGDAGEQRTIASTWQSGSVDEPCFALTVPTEVTVHAGVAVLDLGQWTAPFSLR